MSIIINPGSGPVRGGTFEHAKANMFKFCQDLVTTGVAKEAGFDYDPGGDSEGRFAFILTADGQEYAIDMPGLPLDRVRYIDEKTQNIWHFPRLYVDGSSRVWEFALSQCVPPEEDA